MFGRLQNVCIRGKTDQEKELREREAPVGTGPALGPNVEARVGASSQRFSEKWEECHQLRMQVEGGEV